MIFDIFTKLIYSSLIFVFFYDSFHFKLDNKTWRKCRKIDSEILQIELVFTTSVDDVKEIDKKIAVFAWSRRNLRQHDLSPICGTLENSTLLGDNSQSKLASQSPEIFSRTLPVHRRSCHMCASCRHFNSKIEYKNIFLFYCTWCCCWLCQSKNIWVTDLWQFIDLRRQCSILDVII